MTCRVSQVVVIVFVDELKTNLIVVVVVVVVIVVNEISSRNLGSNCFCCSC